MLCMFKFVSPTTSVFIISVVAIGFDSHTISMSTPPKHSYRDTLNVLNNGEAVAKCIFIRKRNGIL